MNKKSIVALVVCASVIVFGGFIGLIALVQELTKQRARDNAIRQVEQDSDLRQRMQREREENRAHATTVFADAARPTAAETAEFAPILDDLGRALDNSDAAKVRGCFDINRLIQELNDIDALKHLPGGSSLANQNAFRKGLTSNFANALIAQELLRWSAVDIRHIRWSKNRSEVMLIAKHMTSDVEDDSMQMRWWLVRDPAGWKIYDLEDMGVGLRFTRGIALIVNSNLLAHAANNPEAVRLAAGSIPRAMKLLMDGDFFNGNIALEPARKFPWPPEFQAILEIAEGLLLLGNEDPEGALHRFETSERLLPGMPLAVLSRSTALIELGRYEEAMPGITRCKKELGSSCNICFIEGCALEGLGLKAEAADAYREALDEMAQDPKPFIALRRVLPDGEKGELGTRLEKAKNPRALYDHVIYDAIGDNDTAAVDALLDTMLRLQPNDPQLFGDDIRRKIKKAQFAEALAIMRRGLELNTSQDRKMVLYAYLYAMIGAEKALEAYANVPDEYVEAAFRTLAGSLEYDLLELEEEAGEHTAQAVKQLRAFIAAHGKRMPDDPWLNYYDGILLKHAKQYEKAEMAFAAGAAKLPHNRYLPWETTDTIDYSTDGFRSHRVDCYYKLKKGLDAYRDLGPVRQTFEQLANLYDMEKDFDGLGALLELHAEKDAADPTRKFWMAHLLYRKGEYARAVLVYYKYLEQEENHMYLWRARDELVRARLRVSVAGAAESIKELGAENLSSALRAAVAAANDDHIELERLLEESTQFGGKTWFYSDEDFRRCFAKEKYLDLRRKYPDPNPPPKLEG